MRNFFKVAEGADVLPLLHALDFHPELWNLYRFRTTYTGTPHVDVDDVWLRFSSTEKTVDPEEVGEVINDGAPVWYPAFQLLPQARPLILDLMRRVEGYELGRVLVTRIRPGGRILPHADADGAYVNDRDRARYHVVLQGLPGSLFSCGGETVCMRTGDVWWFDARQTHEIVNNSADDRIHLIVDIRRLP